MEASNCLSCKEEPKHNTRGYRKSSISAFRSWQISDQSVSKMNINTTFISFSPTEKCWGIKLLGSGRIQSELIPFLPEGYTVQYVQFIQLYHMRSYKRSMRANLNTDKVKCLPIVDNRTINIIDSNYK